MTPQTELKFNPETYRYEYVIRNYHVGLETRKLIIEKMDFLNEAFDDMEDAYKQQFFLLVFRSFANMAIVYLLQRGVLGDGFLPGPVVAAMMFVAFSICFGYYLLKERKITRDFVRTVYAVKSELTIVMFRDIKRRKRLNEQRERHDKQKMKRERQQNKSQNSA